MVVVSTRGQARSGGSGQARPRVVKSGVARRALAQSGGVVGTNRDDDKRGALRSSERAGRRSVKSKRHEGTQRAATCNVRWTTGTAQTTTKTERWRRNRSCTSRSFEPSTLRRTRHGAEPAEPQGLIRSSGSNGASSCAQRGERVGVNASG